jgi:hypothetical protein
MGDGPGMTSQKRSGIVTPTSTLNCTRIDACANAMYKLYAFSGQSGAVMIVDLHQMRVVSILHAHDEWTAAAASTVVTIPYSGVTETLYVTLSRACELKTWKILEKDVNAKGKKVATVQNCTTFSRIEKRTFSPESSAAKPSKSPPIQSHIPKSDDEVSSDAPLGDHFVDDEDDDVCFPLSLAVSADNTFVVIVFQQHFTVYLCSSMKPLVTVQLSDLEQSLLIASSSSSNATPHRDVFRASSYPEYSWKEDSFSDATFVSSHCIIVMTRMGRAISYELIGFHVFEHSLSQAFTPFGMNVSAEFSVHVSSVTPLIEEHPHGSTNGISDLFVIPLHIYHTASPQPHRTIPPLSFSSVSSLSSSQVVKTACDFMTFDEIPRYMNAETFPAKANSRILAIGNQFGTLAIWGIALPNMSVPLYGGGEGKKTSTLSAQSGIPALTPLSNRKGVQADAREEEKLQKLRSSFFSETL